MKEIKLYQCSICHTQYKDKLTCQKCEKSHVIPKKVKDCRYIPFRNNEKGYPCQVHIEMEDGKVIIYKR